METLYGELAETITNLIKTGTFRVGDRIPSIRVMSRRLGVSLNTVKEAYWLLETRRLIQGRPQSGYFVRECPTMVHRPPSSLEKTLLDPHEILPCNLREEDPGFWRDKAYTGWALARAAPDSSLLPNRILNGFLATICREAADDFGEYDPPKGLLDLRIEVARLALDAGVSLSPEDWLITGGTIMGVSLALDALCREGDTLAVETPTYSEFLKLFKHKGLRVLEIPSSHNEGMSLDVLEWALDRHEVRAVLTVPTFNNPGGFTMPNHRKRALVELLSRRQIPLIEDDAYGDLSFLDQRPPACKAYDSDGTVIYCSSISKTLSPGYRVGWIAGGRWHEALTKRKGMAGMAAASPTQAAVARFLAQGSYSRCLRRLRRALADQTRAIATLVEERFPPGTVVNHPAGGLVLWVELPEGHDSRALYQRAAQEGIFIRPGEVFSATDRLRSCLRLGTGTWNIEVERALCRLAELTVDPPQGFPHP